MKLLFPDYYLKSIHEIDLDLLTKENKKLLIFDIDNTLVPHYIERPTQEVIDFFRLVQDKGFKIALLSNNKKERVLLFNENLKLPIVYKAGKPKKKKILSLIKRLDCLPVQTVVIGDQVFTDVLVAKRLNIVSILVEPISDKDEFLVSLKRGLERKILKMYLKEKYRLVHKD